MDKLSNEVLIQIFTYLHRIQKTKCMLVCRKWAHIICTGLDLETVSISSSPSSELFNYQYKVLIDRVLKDANSGKRCKRLSLDHHSRIGFDKVTLAELFPNLTFLALLLIETKSSNNTPKFNQIQSDKLKSWRNSLETLIERSYTKRLVDFLDTGVFRRLTTLVISPDSKVMYKSFSELSRTLKNTPNLKNIHLNYHHIDISDLEELHKNVPTLVSLVLNSCKLESTRVSSHSIQNSSTLNTLKISNLSTTLELTPEIVRFFTSTYVNLHSFSLVMDEYNYASYRNRDPDLESVFTDLVTKIGNKLINFEFKISVKTPHVYSFLEESMPRLKHLDINVFLAKRALYKMISLANSHHLVTLSLVQVPPICFSVFKNLPELKTLKLAFKRKMINWPPVQLDKMVQHLSERLETLELAYITIDSTQRLCSSNIKRLKLTYTEITENASTVFATCFNKMVSLILYYCRIQGDLYLSNHRLSYVDIVYYERYHYLAGDMEEDVLDKNKRIATHLKLTRGSSTNYYLYRKPLYNGVNPRYNAEYCEVHDHSFRTISKSSAYNEALKYLHFKCSSVQSFYYNGYLLL